MFEEGAHRRLLSAVLVIATLAGPPPLASAGRQRPTADWVPLTGLVRLSRTWAHSGGHAEPALDFSVGRRQRVPVHAAGDGTVVGVIDTCPSSSATGRHRGCNGGLGNTVEIAHGDGRTSVYAHLSPGSIGVAPGDWVCRGCAVALTGWSGNVHPSGPRGAHLHYEERRNGKPVSPGVMFARTRRGRVAYPPTGASWSELGRERTALRNRGFPRPGDPPPTCFGWAVNIQGSPGSERLRGTSGIDVILGGEGHDVIEGLGGDDQLCGGEGDDRLTGDAGSDRLDGQGGNDTCYQGEANGYESAGEGSVAGCELPTYVLSVEASCCASVVSDPPGILCPGDCEEAFGTHTSVRLTASPGLAFSWEGCDGSTATTCTVVMNADRWVQVE